jgi:hypothetical protein
MKRCFVQSNWQKVPTIIPSLKRMRRSQASPVFLQTISKPIEQLYPVKMLVNLFLKLERFNNKVPKIRTSSYRSKTKKRLTDHPTKTFLMLKWPTPTLIVIATNLVHLLNRPNRGIIIKQIVIRRLLLAKWMKNADMICNLCNISKCNRG